VRTALVVSAFLGPVALFFLVRIPLGCSVLNLLGLPWAPEVELAVTVLGWIVGIGALVTIVLGFTTRPLRWMSFGIVMIWIASSPIWMALLLATAFGDPGPDTCRVV